MVAVPAETPETIPLDEPTVETGVLLLLQVPPEVRSPSVVVMPWQTANVPVIADGPAITVTDWVTKQPVPKA